MTGSASSSAGTLADGRTRDRVVRLLLEGGPATAASLAEQLGISPAAVRRHLEALVAGGTATSGTGRPTGTRGRPARTYRLSAAGHAGLQTAYDDLAAAALRHLADTGGRAAVGSFAAARSAELERRVRETMGDPATGGAPPERAPALARALTAHGYAASTSATATGSAQLCQHHCPVQAVAAEFPELCEAETAALGRLLGTHVQRLATLAHGDGVCTTHIPAPGPPTAPRPPGAPGPATGKISTHGRRSPTQRTDAAARTDSPAPASPQLRRTTA